jgi:hypothetical protein
MPEVVKDYTSTIALNILDRFKEKLSMSKAS